tara:strand:- start:4078 stop:4368 length:291 start_codon:yes stop_codon:yes gene_type:complete
MKEYKNFKTNTLMVERKISDGNEYRRVTIYDKKGSVREIKNYKNDQLNGKVVSFWSNGKIQAEGSYISGRRLGVWKSYNKKGKILVEEKHIKSFSN